MQIQNEALYTLIKIDNKGFGENIANELSKNIIIYFTQEYVLNATDTAYLLSLLKMVSDKNGILVCTGKIQLNEFINVPTLHEAIEYIMMHELENDLLGDL